ncbi:hypothetical protein KL907_001041 [Ogataea polymorpha]|nr:hypothetical protein KL907_001041 [Ogataea polymorpha]
MFTCQSDFQRLGNNAEIVFWYISGTKSRNTSDLGARMNPGAVLRSQSDRFFAVIAKKRPLRKPDKISKDIAEEKAKKRPDFELVWHIVRFVASFGAQIAKVRQPGQLESF